TAYHSDNLHINIGHSQPTTPSGGSIRGEHAVLTRHPNDYKSSITRHCLSATPANVAMTAPAA
ncbi:MAG: hypothetical protein JXB07_21280, partial [Anaerolineae bacterium]|nr:hypothetical protein [Anaerolineae bacterium]